MLDTAQLAPEQRRPITRDEFYRMREAGLFLDEEVELIEGVVVRMMPRDEKHDGPIERLNELLMPRLVGRARVRVQLGFAIGDYTMVKPDLAILWKAEPTDEQPSRALVIIEVSQTSLKFDRTLKLRLYASSGVAEYWVVNTIARDIEVYTTPEGERYRDVTRYGPGDRISLGPFSDVVVAINDVFV